MKISKLFHWLYAILMFLPFGLLVFNALASMWSGGVVNVDTWKSYILTISYSSEYVITPLDSIGSVYNYLLQSLFGFDYADELPYIIENLLTYWTSISIIWLVFDVFMYVPLLVHRWIDKAKLE